ncbi:MarR family winged helix-turn-helix transcriptional regulator [Paracoccus indicus]|uniref:MarR family winged helix-turn-helix transcriptional regulator n=1 Tax=Paracoccus indicus TaxID=2079229 RepID=UPI001FE345E4|nr:MarR family transcriptional regulator [Paracoccus indicus]
MPRPPQSDSVDDQSHQILDVILHLMRDLRRCYDRRARDMGLTLSRAKALTTLARNEGITQTRLAADLAIEAPTLKRQIDALVADGFIRREPTQDDARKNALFLTDRGRDAAIVEFTMRLRRDLLEGIPRQDLDQVMRVLDQITCNIHELDRT